MKYKPNKVLPHSLFWIGMLLAGVIMIVAALALQAVKQKEQKMQTVSELLELELQQMNKDQADKLEGDAKEEHKKDHIAGNEAQAQSSDSTVEQAEPTDNNLAQEPVNTDTSSDQEPASNLNDKININTATADELQALKGIGPSKAEAIIKDREQKGDFRSIQEIKRVKGIGEKLFEGIKESIVALR